ncbi:MAG: hypothetical protein R3195_13495 [Gemmatimonadota bacterium]|nr:hypothetical protein [Gemmatimonadota bacterium]
MTIRRALVGPVSVALAVGGCLTASNIEEHRGDGETRCYVAPYDVLWSAAEEAMRRVGLELERANRDAGVLVGRSYRPEVEDPAEMALEADQGERVAVFIEEDSVDGRGRSIWALEVVSRAIFALDPSARDWTEMVFLAIEERIPEEYVTPDEDIGACTRARGR